MFCNENQISRIIYYISIKRSFKSPNIKPFILPSIQPNIKTQEEQLRTWKKLVLDYQKHLKKCTLNLGDDTELFSNTTINRKLPVDGQSLVLSELEKSGNALAVDKRRLQWEVYWYTLDELGNLIYKYISDNGLNNTVCTVFELVSGDDTAQEEFHGLEESVVLRCLRVLQANGKCEVFEDGEGVKFF